MLVDEESLVIDPDDFSGDEDAQPGLPGNVGADENVPQDIHVDSQHLPQVSCVPVLQKTIDNACKKLYVPWASQLVMDLTLYRDSEETLIKGDIMQYATKGKKTRKSRGKNNLNKEVEPALLVYFDVKKYPVGEDYFDGPGYEALCRDLCEAAIKSGFYLVKNGFQERKKLHCQEFTCNRYQTYKGDMNKKRNSSSVYRGTAFNNKSLSRGSVGINMPRMTCTMKPICKHNRCKFTFYVAFDGIGFFVAPGGSNMHCHHPRLNEEEIFFPSKHLTPEDKGIVQDFGKTHASYAIAANLIEVRTGKTLSCHKLRRLSGLCDRLLNKIDGIKSLDLTEKMTHYLEKNKYEYMQLVHNETNSQIFNQVNLMDKYAHEVQLPNNKKSSCLSFLVSKTNNNQRLIPFPSTLPPCFRPFTYLILLYMYITL